MSDIDTLSYRLYDVWSNNLEFVLDTNAPNLLTPETRILLIEPDRIEADSLKTIIESVGGKVTRVHDYHHTMSLIDLISPPELILINMEMPFLNSYRLIEYFRNTHAWRKLPIIALLNSSDKFTLSRALQVGANECLIKPFTNEELLNCINSRLVLTANSPARSVA